MHCRNQEWDRIYVDSFLIRQYNFKYIDLTLKKVTGFNFFRSPESNNEPLLVYRLIVVIKKCEIAFCLKKLCHFFDLCVWVHIFVIFRRI
jgi:hypothetical protein